MQYQALIDNTKDGISQLFQNPERFIICNNPSEVEQKFNEIEEANRQGKYVVGWFSYELGYFFEERLKHFSLGVRASPCACPDATKEMLFCVGVFDGVGASPRACPNKRVATGGYPYHKSKLKTNISKEDYLKNIDKIKEYIKNGDVYQINYTFKYLFEYNGCPFDLYNKIKQNQKVEYGALLNFPDYTILSFSPELFFKKEGNIITSKPMKGTAPKNTNPNDLKNDPKNRAENLMIVDLIRNDISRIADNVTVPDLFTIEEYETLYQMTSTVTGHLKQNINLYNIFKNLFPCGSIIGTPKIRAMEIIKQLEKEKRKVYTGAIGCISPNGDISMSVAIRTLMLDKQGKGEFGIGSGIVYKSKPQMEYEECLLKAEFLLMSLK